MDLALPTTFEMMSAIVSAAVYLLVGTAALTRAPKDIRARLFFLTALASAPAYLVTVLFWARGYAAATHLSVPIVMGLALAMGSLTLFHFTQVFPWRRPWIRRYGRWLSIGYAGAPIAWAVAVWAVAPVLQAFAEVPELGSGGVGAVSAGITEALVLLVVAVPLLFLIGLVLPFGALMSLYKTWNEAKAAGAESARIATFWILISQMAGGVLAILVIPLLRIAAPTGPWVTIAAALLFAFGLLMPIAFAAGVWKYRVLDIDVNGGPGQPLP